MRKQFLIKLKMHIHKPQPTIAEGMSSHKLWKGRCGKISAEVMEFIDIFSNVSRKVSQSRILNRSRDMEVGPNTKATPSSGNMKNSIPQSSAPPIVRTNFGGLLPAIGLITLRSISSGPLSFGTLKKATFGPQYIILHILLLSS